MQASEKIKEQVTLTRQTIELALGNAVKKVFEKKKQLKKGPNGEDPVLKIVVIGDQDTSSSPNPKSTLIGLLSQPNFDKAICRSGTDFVTRSSYKINEQNESVTLQIWDTPGQARYRNIMSSCFRLASVVFLLCNANDASVAENASIWINQAKNSNSECTIMLLANTHSGSTQLSSLEQCAKDNFILFQPIQIPPNFAELSQHLSLYNNRMTTFFKTVLVKGLRERKEGKATEATNAQKSVVQIEELRRIIADESWNSLESDGAPSPR